MLLLLMTFVAGFLTACGTRADPMAGESTPTPPISVAAAPSSSTMEFIEPSAATSPVAQAAPAATPGSPVLEAGGSAQIAGMLVSPSTLGVQDGKLCTKVMYTNQGEQNALGSPFDWRLQGPSGAVVAPIPAEGEFLAAEITPGQTVTGTLCFPNDEDRDHGIWRIMYLAPPPNVDVAVFEQKR